MKDRRVNFPRCLQISDVTFTIYWTLKDIHTFFLLFKNDVTNGDCSLSDWKDGSVTNGPFHPTWMHILSFIYDLLCLRLFTMRLTPTVFPHLHWHRNTPFQIALSRAKLMCIKKWKKKNLLKKALFSFHSNA